MFKASHLVLTAALVAGVSTQGLAQTSATAAPAATNAKPAYDPNEKVCEKQEVTGSRLGYKRICKTRAEWAQSRLQDRQELERVQVQRGAKAE